MKSNLLIEKLKADNCEIFLDKAESLYLTEEVINLKINNSLDINSQSKVLKIFKENNSVNYYSNKDISKLSKNLLNSLKKKLAKEEIGRDYATPTGATSAVNDAGIISPETIAVDKGFDPSAFFNDEDEDLKPVLIRNILAKYL